MAHTRSARKRHRQSLERNQRNRHWRSSCRNAVREVRRSAATGEADLEARIRRAERLLRKAASKGVFNPRTVARTVSRLHALV